jgi:hypothetical protein
MFRLFCKNSDYAGPSWDCYVHPNVGHLKWQELVVIFQNFWKSSHISTYMHLFDPSLIPNLFLTPPFWIMPVHALKLGHWPPTMIYKWAADISAGNELSFPPSPFSLFPITSFAPPHLDLAKIQVSFFFFFNIF